MQPRGEAGDVIEERLLGGTTDLLCTVVEPLKDLEIHVVYTPASGENAGRECKLARKFVEEFLDQPQHPLPSEYEPFPRKTCFFLPGVRLWAHAYEKQPGRFSWQAPRRRHPENNAKTRAVWSAGPWRVWGVLRLRQDGARRLH